MTVRASFQALVPGLLRILPRGTRDDRQRVLVMLRVLGPQAAAAVPWLTMFLRLPDHDYRELACEALRTIGPAAEPAVDDLCRVMLDRTGWFERGAAANALAWIGAPRALPHLVTMARDRDRQGPGWLAVEAIGAFGAAAAPFLPALIRTMAVELRHTHERSDAGNLAHTILRVCRAAPDVRRISAGSRRLLLRCARSRRLRNWRETLDDAVAILEGKPRPAKPDRHDRRGRRWYGEIWDAVRMPPATQAFARFVPTILRLASGEDPVAQHRALVLLALVGAQGAAAVPMLVRCLRSSTEAIRLAAYAGLHNIGPKAIAAYSALRAVATSRRKLDREWAIDALAAVGEGQAVPELAAAARSRVDGVRWAALRALDDLGARGGAAVPSLLTLLERRLRERPKEPDRLLITLLRLSAGVSDATVARRAVRAFLRCLRVHRDNSAWQSQARAGIKLYGRVVASGTVEPPTA